MLTNLTVSTTWDVDRYISTITPAQSGQNLRQEAEQERRFPPIFGAPFPTLFEPAAITDCHGHVLVWHLPTIFLGGVQVRMHPGDVDT
jgi:hypothetical protein